MQAQEFTRLMVYVFFILRVLIFTFAILNAYLILLVISIFKELEKGGEK